MAVFWVLAPYNLVEVHRRFGRFFPLNHEGNKFISETSVKFYQTTRRSIPEEPAS
jgi:hypothetical protein